MTTPVITAVAVCPHPPLLVPEIAGTASSETDELRAACDAAVAQLLSSAPEQIVVIGANGSRHGLRGFAPGLAALPAAELPLSLAIGSWLLDRAAVDPAVRDGRAPTRHLVAVRPDGTADTEWPDVSTPTGLLVMADGSARRTVKAPGYLDERAEPFDAVITKALAEADLDVLANLDVEMSEELWVGGVGAWRALAAIARRCGRRWQAQVRYDAAPYGVQYTVASWLPA